MGGHAAGDMASGLIIDRLRTLEENGTGGLEHRARMVLSEANAHLCACNESAVPPTNMGTTVALLGIEGAQYFCLWSGDSRIYNLRDGSLVQISNDHRYIQALIDAGALSEAEASRHPQRHIVTHAIGVERDFRLDGRKCALVSNDVFVLLTDGVSSVCSDDEIAARICINNLEASADDLTELCLTRGAPDNFSLILVAPVIA